MYRTPRPVSAVVLMFLAGCQREPSDARWSPLESLHQESLAFLRQGDLDQASRHFQQGLDRAQSELDRARFGAGLGHCHQQAMRFRAALAAFRLALEHARSSGDPEQIAAILGGIAGVYARLGDVEHAVLATDQALASRPNQAREHALRLNRAIGLFQLGRPTEAEKAFQDLLAAVRHTENYARVLENLGYQFVLQGRLVEAEKALDESTAVRVRSKDPDLPDSRYVMARLRQRQDRFHDALALLDRYLASPGRHYRLHHVLHLRGQVLESLGLSERALDDYRRAIAEIRRSRTQVIPTERFQATSEARVADIFDDFIRLAVRKPDPKSWQEALGVADESRAAAYRAAMFTPEEWSARLPDAYWGTLARLQALETAGRLLTPLERAESDRLRLRLVEWESDLANGLSIPEPDASPDPRTWVATDEAAFVFHTAPGSSVLWIITRETLRVVQLPGEKELASSVVGLRQALLSDSPRKGGEALPRIFSRELSGPETTKYYWTIVPDGPLFELPFAALSVKDQMLIDRHAISLAATLTPASGGRTAPWTRKAAIFGDPIYNGADSRLGVLRFSPASLELNRLPGSAEEITRTSRTWRGAGWDAETFSGSQATREQLFKVMEERPAVLHLATHVIPGENGQAAPHLALSLTPGSDRPPTVSARDLASRRSAPGLVVMSGCDSGGGPVWRAAGLMGLTRAWLLSGASTVVATLWPVPDDSGQFSELMHRRLAAEKGESIASTEQQELRRATARALRGAMIEARDGGVIPPVTWAAFFSMGRN